MTAVGGMLLLAQGNGDSTSIVPDSPAHWMGAIATTLSFVNIVGGFLITGKMLNLFRRKEDPDDFFVYYAIPAAVSQHMFIAFGLLFSLSLIFSILCCCS